MANLSTERLSYQLALKALLESLNLEGSSQELLPLRLSLINMVKIKLDEIVPEGEGIAYELDSEPNTSDPFDFYIDGLLDEAAKNVLMEAPIEVLNTKSYDATASDNGNTGYVILPDDYLRLAVFKMADWDRAVTKPITVRDKKYNLQFNKFTRGGTAKPVLVLTQKKVGGEGRKVFEYYSVKNSHDIETFLYVALVPAQDVQDDLYDSLTWMCASKILQNTNQIDLSKLAIEQARFCYQKN